MDKHLIVVSVDAMVYEDLALLSRLPNVGKLLGEGSLVRRINTIYPSLTHPVHATLMSGCPAGRTGISNNERFMPGLMAKPWNNRLEQMRCETIFHAARRAGLRTCACRWPMTAGGFDVITYLVPEVMDSETREQPDLEKLYQSACTPALFEGIVKPRLPILANPEKYPSYEIFSLTCACDIIRRYRPALLMTHPGMVDHNRHLSGLFSPLVDDALRMTDEWIGWLMQAVKDARIMDTTSFAIVSDHGHLEYCRTIALNALLQERGYLYTDADGNLTDWDVYAMGSGLSAQIYVKDRSKLSEIYAMLMEMGRIGLYGFSEVLTAAEASQRYGLYGDFAFVVEGDGYTAFTSDWHPPIVRPNPVEEYAVHHSGHGHMPEKGPQPPMIVAGPAFRTGVELETETILNEAPTFAAALGLTLPQAQGRPIEALLR